MWQWLVYLVVDRFSGLWSRNDRLWVFGARGGSGFVDNAKYLYLWVAANEPSVRPVWLSTDDDVVDALQQQGYEAYHAHSIRGRLLTLRAGVVFVTQGLRDLHMGSTAGATLVQLWHGLPLKTIAWDAEWPDQPWPVRRCHAYMADEIDLVTAPSTAAIEPLASGLGVAPDRFVVTGYPRADAFAEEIDGARLTVDESLLDRIESQAADGAVVFYLPTYREDGKSFVDAFDTAAVGELLEERGAHLYIKAHPDEPVTAVADHPRVHWLPASVDPYLVLPHADVLVTDYSSVFFDFLAADRPIVFFAYDRSAYTAARGFYFDYESVTPGPIATDVDELGTALAEALEATAGGTDPYATARRRLRERFCPVPPGAASKRVSEAVSRLVSGDPESRRHRSNCSSDRSTAELIEF
ncbi:CDP-glycerol glycerophosphotransferase family protein [Halohasta salina]|uniref:CDP-glycerol glycerophosphotransferase family protein n=1 Tax=Halohasta salina TaxID=2961621 RepID=UPI0020A37E9B|nr:CDP-glycerol glycerophosphotransferase family protein [Halohasta salina]